VVSDVTTGRDGANVWAIQTTTVTCSKCGVVEVDTPPLDAADESDAVGRHLAEKHGGLKQAAPHDLRHEHLGSGSR
jgi:hypothetical protein